VVGNALYVVGDETVERAGSVASDGVVLFARRALSSGCVGEDTQGQDVGGGGAADNGAAVERRVYRGAALCAEFCERQVAYQQMGAGEDSARIAEETDIGG